MPQKFCEWCNGKLGPAPVKEPRETAWYGDKGLTYTYSGKAMNPLPWTPSLSDIKTKIEDQLKAHYSITSKFSSVLINKYRNGNDSLGWHSDNEKELGLEPVIASISLGATREFQLRTKGDKKTITIQLVDGSLFVMRGKTQELWQHQIPKDKKLLVSKGKQSELFPTAPNTTIDIQNNIELQIANNGLVLDFEDKDNQSLSIDGCGISCILYPNFLGSSSQSYFNEFEKDSNLKQGKVQLPFNRTLICMQCNKEHPPAEGKPIPKEEPLSNDGLTRINLTFRVIKA